MRFQREEDIFSVNGVRCDITLGDAKTSKYDPTRTKETRRNLKKTVLMATIWTADGETHGTREVTRD